MDNKFTLEIHTIEKTVYKDHAKEVSFFTKNGQLTILPNHIPVITKITPGEIRYKDYKGFHHAFTHGGFAKITNKRVIILADLVETIEELKEKEEEIKKQIQEAQERAQELKKEKTKNIKAIASASVDFSLATSKLKMIKRRKHH